MSYADDAADTSKHDEKALVNLNRLAIQFIDQERKIADLETQLKNEKEKFTRLSEIDIPKEMRLLELESFPIPKRNDGAELELKERTFASFPKMDEEPEKALVATKWLLKNKHGSVLRQNVNIEFSVEDNKKVDALIGQLIKKYKGASITRKVSVHASTLAKLVRTLRASGEAPPLETLGATVKDVVSIKRPKQKV